MKSALLVICAVISCLSVGELRAQDVGAACNVARSGAAGTCRIISSCPEVINDIIKNSRYPASCGFVGPQQVVCCPNPPVVTTAKPVVKSNRVSARSKFTFSRCKQSFVKENSNLTIYWSQNVESTSRPCTKMLAYSLALDNHQPYSRWTDVTFDLCLLSLEVK